MPTHSADEETRWATSTRGPQTSAFSPAAASQYPVSGDILQGRFQLEAELGRGGMGIVYKALDFRRQEADDREPYVAIKILNPDLIDDPLFLRALQRESKRCQNLPHPNIITVFDFDRDGRNVFMTMEYLEGKTLKQVVRENPKGFSLKVAWPWIRGMASALNFAHQNGIVHSDFKPGNVFLSKDSVKVLDFGLASLVNRTHDHDKTLVDARSLGAYTPCYASLETLQDEPADIADDLYAFACTVYELLSGRHPYHRLTALQAAEAQIAPKRPQGLNPRQWRALELGLGLQREKRCRIGSISQLANELDPNREASNGTVIAGIASVIVLALIAVGFFWKSAPLSRPAREQQEPAVVAEQPVKTGEPAPAAPGPNTVEIKNPLPLGEGRVREKALDVSTTLSQASASLALTPTRLRAGEGLDSTVLTPRASPVSTETSPVSQGPEIDSALLERLGGNFAMSEDGQVAAGVDRRRYTIGDKLALRIVAVASRHLYVFYVNSSDEADQLYPNQHQPDRLVKANRIVDVPPTGKSDFVLRVAKPVGHDRIVVVATSDAVDKPKRLLTPVPGDASSRLTIGIDVVP